MGLQKGSFVGFCVTRNLSPSHLGMAAWFPNMDREIKKKKISLLLSEKQVLACILGLKRRQQHVQYKTVPVKKFLPCPSHVTYLPKVNVWSTKSLQACWNCIVDGELNFLPALGQ